MPTLVLLAGPNGAGKTTLINSLLRERAEVFQFVNPDEVAPLVIPDARQRDPGRTDPPLMPPGRRGAAVRAKG